MNKVVDMAYKKLMVNEIVYCKMLKCNFFFFETYHYVEFEGICFTCHA